jgi:hypothetical protein
VVMAHGLAPKQVVVPRSMVALSALQGLLEVEVGIPVDRQRLR